MNQKKILMLGGAFSQIPAIEEAKQEGCYVITCDYLPTNPGHKFSDSYVNISTVNQEQILDYARKNKIDGISAYASDPAAQTAAYVAKELNLPGTGLEATRMLSEKDLFRSFQRDKGFLYPEFISVCPEDNIELTARQIKFPCYVKPVDSSGSKGVTKIFKADRLKAAVECAMNMSRKKRVIVEREISSPYNQIHGEGFVVNGKLMFVELGDQCFKDSVPIGTSCPSVLPLDLMQAAKIEVSRLIELSGFITGAINIELRVGADNGIYIVEIGPRSGGNYMPQLMEFATGFDEVKACIKACLGEPIPIKLNPQNRNYAFQYIIGSDKSGIFKTIKISEYAQSMLQKLYVHKQSGDRVEEYQNSSNVVGVALFKTTSRDCLMDLIENIKMHVTVILEKQSR